MNVTLLQFLSLVLGFCLWAALGFFGKVPLDPLIALLQMGLGGLITHMLKSDAVQTSAVTPSPPSPGGQSGFVLVRMLAVIAAIAIGLAMLSGCTTTTASVVRGYEAQAKAGVQMFDDNQLMVLRDAMCLQPYGAIVRHPEVQPAIASLCGQMANATSIDPAQAQRLLDIAKQLGVTAASAPAAAASNAK